MVRNGGRRRGVLPHSDPAGDRTPAFEDDLPYVVAYVELEEGPLFCTNIVGCAIDDVENGMEVEVTFDRIDGELSVPKFRPR